MVQENFGTREIMFYTVLYISSKKSLPMLETRFYLPIGFKISCIKKRCFSDQVTQGQTIHPYLMIDIQTKSI